MKKPPITIIKPDEMGHGFQCSVKVSDKEGFIGIGTGPTKKQAKENAGIASGLTKDKVIVVERYDVTSVLLGYNYIQFTLIAATCALQVLLPNHAKKVIENAKSWGDKDKSQAGLEEYYKLIYLFYL